MTLFDYYLLKGGFPEMIKYDDDEFLMRIYEDILYKDLIVKCKIKNIKQFHSIQVSYGLDNLLTREREIKAMVDAASELPHTKNLLLTYDEEDTYVEKGVEIIIMPVWKWILGIDIVP